jgi:hypothetical protein
MGALFASQHGDAGTPVGMTADFEKGDKVEWNSHGGKAVGEVVRSEKSGREAVHKPGALKRR